MKALHNVKAYLQLDLQTLAESVKYENVRGIPFYNKSIISEEKENGCENRKIIQQN